MNNPNDRMQQFNAFPHDMLYNFNSYQDGGTIL